MKSKNLKITILSLAVAVTFLACESKNNASNQLSITTSNQSAVSALVFNSIDSATPQMPKSSTTTQSSSSLSILLPNYTTLQAPPTVDTFYTCSDGGDITYTASNSNYEYNDCMVSGVKTDGTIKVDYNATKGEIIYTLSDYSFISAKKEYRTSATSYTISQGKINYSSTGTTIVEGKTTSFKNYDYSLILLNNQINISINGYIKANNLGEWVNVKTTQSLQLNDKTCPTAGEILVTGKNSKLKLAFSPDKSIDLFLNATLTQEFIDCNEMPVVGGL